MELLLKITDIKDLEILVPLLNRLGVKWESTSGNQPPSGRSREELWEIISAGGDASYFGDPVEWQRGERTDRILPGREG